MATVSKKAAVSFDNFAEVWERLGEVPLERIRVRPPPGTATEPVLPGFRLHLKDLFAKLPRRKGR